MNCPKCNSAVGPELLFCSECGFKIENIPLCKECGTPLKDGVLFCPSCRTPSRSEGKSMGDNSAHVKNDNTNNNRTSKEEIKAEENSDKAFLKIDDSLEKTMTIPVIKPNNHRPSDYVDNAAAERKNSEYKNSVNGNFSGGNVQSSGEGLNSGRLPVKKKKTIARKKQTKLSRTQKNILLFLFVFIAVVFLGLAGISTAIKVTHNKPLKTTGITVKKKEKVVTEPPKGYEDNETTSEKDYGSSRHIAIYEPLIDLEYEFARGISVDNVINPDMGDEMKSYENQEYSFICPVPGNFTLEAEGPVEVRYLSRDKTAYIDIGALKNTGNWSVASVRDAVIGTLGGTVDYQAGGEDWFAVSVIKNGTYYYRKSFVAGETIRYFEIVYPEEYSQVFNICVSDIDAGFRQVK